MYRPRWALLAGVGEPLKVQPLCQNAGLEKALQGDADEARKNISGYKNLTVNGKSPADALKGMSNKQTVDLDNQITNFFESNMLSKPGTQIGLALATLGAEGIEAAFTTGSGQRFAALKYANPVGSALKTDTYHSTDFWMREAVADHGHVFTITGGDGVQRTLIQMPSEVNGTAGRFEYIMDKGNLTHETFIEGGSINGVPNVK